MSATLSASRRRNPSLPPACSSKGNASLTRQGIRQLAGNAAHPVSRQTSWRAKTHLVPK